MRCPSCGSENMPQLDRCMRCGQGLRRQLAPWGDVLPPRRAQRTERYVQERTQELRRAVRSGRTGLRRLWNIFWYQVDTSSEDVIVHKSPTLAGLLSLVPGQGQVHVGQPIIGLWVFLASLACAATFTLTVHSWVSNLILLVSLLAYAGEIAWAVAYARSRNDARPIQRELATGAFFAIGLLSSIYTVAFFGTYHHWQVARMAMDLHATSVAVSGGRVQEAMVGEALSRGDGLLIDVRQATIAAIKAGDLIMYRFGGDEPPAVQRVLGAAGDRIMVTEGGLTRNGSVIGPGQEPLLPQGEMHMDERHPQTALVVPSSCYAVLDYQFGFMHGNEAVQNQGLRLIGTSDIVGKVIAVLIPPAHRRWLG